MPADFGPEEFARVGGVSRETMALIENYVGLLHEWRVRHNLVSRASLADVWRRHVWDSAQLERLIPDSARSLIDLGSGAGFPGLVLAVLLRERPRFRTVLYEATGKKCAFLTAAAEQLGVAVEICCARIEDAPRESFNIVTARACAPLVKLLGYAQSFQSAETINLFLKGQNVEVELTEAHKYWRMNAVRHASKSDPSGTILEIRELARVR